MDSDPKASRDPKYSALECELLLGLYYALPFSEGDDESDVNRVISTALRRKSSSVDRQWRNVDLAVRGAALNKTPDKVASSIVNSVTAHRAEPVAAIVTALKLSEAYPAIRALFRFRAEDVTHSCLVQEIDEKWLLNENFFRVLLRLVWLEPRLAFLRDDSTGQILAEIAELIEIDLKLLSDLCKIVYSLRCVSRCGTGEPYAEFFELHLESLRLPPSELRVIAESICESERWHLWTYLRNR